MFHLSYELHGYISRSWSVKLLSSSSSICLNIGHSLSELIIPFSCNNLFKFPNIYSPSTDESEDKLIELFLKQNVTIIDYNIIISKY